MYFIKVLLFIAFKMGCCISYYFCIVYCGIDFKAVAISQSNDPKTHACCTALTGLNLVDIPISQEAEHTLLCDISLGHLRPWVPKEWRKFIFGTMHRLSHPGATSCLISSRYVWHGLNKEVKIWAKQCFAQIFTPEGFVFGSRRCYQCRRTNGQF